MMSKIFYDIIPPKKRTRKIRADFNFNIITAITKIVALLVIVSLNWAGLSAVINTIAYFNDIESAPVNSYSAGTLDFSITNSNIEELIGVELGEDIEFTSVVTKMTGSLDIQYKAYAEKISGNDDFCNALQLETFHSKISYDGDLLAFDTATTTALGTWAFEIKLPHTAANFAHGEECNVDLVFEGWRKDVADSSQSGFVDEERIQLRLTSRMIVLNEFLPNPEGVAYSFDFGDDSSNMPRGEWVELYNNSDVNHDLAGWYIWDDSGDSANKIEITATNTAPSATVIGAHDWLVVYMNKEVFDNTGDTVKLFDSADTLIDSYTYTADNDYCELEPTPEEENSSSASGDCGGVPGNKSYARIPDGIGYWVDPIPTPGRPNILESEIINQGDAIEEASVIEEEPIEEPVEEEELVEEPISDEIEEPVVEEEPIIEEESVEEIPVIAEEPPVEEVITEESQEQGGIIEEINEIIDDVIDEIIDEIMPDEETGDEVVSEPEAPVMEDVLIIEGAPADETPVIEEQPAAEEQPVIAPSNDSAEPPAGE